MYPQLNLQMQIMSWVCQYACKLRLFYRLYLFPEYADACEIWAYVDYISVGQLFSQRQYWLGKCVYYVVKCVINIYIPYIKCGYGSILTQIWYMGVHSDLADAGHSFMFTLWCESVMKATGHFSVNDISHGTKRRPTGYAFHVFCPRYSGLLTQLPLQPAGYGKLSSSYLLCFPFTHWWNNQYKWQQFRILWVSRLFVRCHDTGYKGNSKFMLTSEK